MPSGRAARAGRRRRDRPDDVAHVVAAGGGLRDQRAGLGGLADRADRRWASAAALRRCAAGGRRAVGRPCRSPRRGRRRRGSPRRCSGRGEAAPPSSSLSITTPVNSATIVGPLTNAYDSSVITTRSAIPSSSAGPDTAGPSTTMMIGTTPEQSVSALAAQPPTVQRGEALDDVGAAGAHDARSSGKPLARAVTAACSIIDDESEDSAPLVSRRRPRPRRPRGPSNSRTSARDRADAPGCEGRRPAWPPRLDGAAERERLRADVHAGLLGALQWRSRRAARQQDPGRDARAPGGGAAPSRRRGGGARERRRAGSRPSASGAPRWPARSPAP